MRRRGYDDTGIACGQTRADEFTQCMQKKCVGLVELNDVFRLTQRLPTWLRHQFGYCAVARAGVQNRTSRCAIGCCCDQQSLQVVGSELDAFVESGARERYRGVNALTVRQSTAVKL